MLREKISNPAVFGGSRVWGLECSKWDGAVQNKEPHKCEALEYFDLYDLPENMIDHVRAVLERIEEGVFYSELGWKR